jgi:hypothetical protein
MKADVMAPLALLRPTQITVGLFQVQAKMQMTERLNASERARLMAKHPVQVVIGPGFERYIIDHHHWARAWYELELRETPVVVVDDFSRMSPTEFWKRMERERRIHPYDESGAKCALSALPATVFELATTRIKAWRRLYVKLAAIKSRAVPIPISDGWTSSGLVSKETFRRPAGLPTRF